MRWILRTQHGSHITSAKTTRDRDEQAFMFLGRGKGFGETCTVIATDTRTGRSIELSRPLKRRTITPAKKEGGAE